MPRAWGHSHFFHILFTMNVDDNLAIGIGQKSIKLTKMGTLAQDWEKLIWLGKINKLVCNLRIGGKLWGILAIKPKDKHANVRHRRKYISFLSSMVTQTHTPN